MKGRAVLVIAGAVVALTGVPQAARAAVECPDANNCADVTVGVTGAESLTPGDTFNVELSFKQGADNAQSGGIDETAALAFTLGLGIPGAGSATPLVLADCTLNGDLPASVVPDPSISNFKVVVENASCADGRTHCLCPDAGQVRDNFINLVFYGPNPLPTPGTGGIDIPTLPAGPQKLVTITLRVASGANGTIPLHVFNQVSDTDHPQFTALLSVGDKLAVDQTCVPVSGQPPCSSASDVSQVVTNDSSVDVAGVCVGDCNNDGMVTVDELVTMVNIALGAAPISECEAGDADGSGDIVVNEVILAVNNALNGCNP